MITIHIGLLKTATTSLQDGFAANPRLAYVGYQHLEPLRKAANDAAESGRPLPERVPVGSLASILKAVADRPTILSDERFSGIPYYHYTDKTAETTRAFQIHCARLLKAVAPEARIVVVLREPRGWLVSYYKQFIKLGEPRRLKRYARELRGHLVQSYGVDFLTRLYGELYGEENVHVLPFEMLRAERKDFMDRLGAIIGVPVELPGAVNQSLDDALTEPLRRLGALARFLARKRQWSDAYSRQIRLMLFDVIEGALKDQPHNQEVLIRAIGPMTADLVPPADVLADMRAAVARTVTENPLFAPYRGAYGL